MTLSLVRCDVPDLATRKVAQLYSLQASRGLAPRRERSIARLPAMGPKAPGRDEM